MFLYHYVSLNGASNVYYNRGLAWHDKGSYNRVISDYDKAIELDPRDADAYIGRALACASKGNYGRFCPDL